MRRLRHGRRAGGRPPSTREPVRRERLAYSLPISNTTGTNFEPVITVSATYGAGGSVIAPRLASQLGLPFVDRLISADLSAAAFGSQ